MSADANELVKLIKQASTEAVEAGKPVNVCYGTVVSASPLQIQVEQKMTLGEAQLILTRNVTDYTVSVSVDWTDDDGTAINGTKTMTVNNALTAGETVIMLRWQSGQKFVVLDRIG